MEGVGCVVWGRGKRRVSDEDAACVSSAVSVFVASAPRKDAEVAHLQAVSLLASVQQVALFTRMTLALEAREIAPKFPSRVSSSRVSPTLDAATHSVATWGGHSSMTQRATQPLSPYRKRWRVRVQRNTGRVSIGAPWRTTAVRIAFVSSRWVGGAKYAWCLRPRWFRLGVGRVDDGGWAPF
jgi:hypothetical protein